MIALWFESVGANVGAFDSARGSHVQKATNKGSARSVVTLAMPLHSSTDAGDEMGPKKSAHAAGSTPVEPAPSIHAPTPRCSRMMAGSRRVIREPSRELSSGGRR